MVFIFVLWFLYLFCTNPFISALSAHYSSLIIITKPEFLNTYRFLRMAFAVPVTELSGHIPVGDRSFALVYGWHVTRL